MAQDPRILSDGDLRLRPARLPDDVAAAVPWYQDPEVLYYSEGEGTPAYDTDGVAGMYGYLSAIGELYIIEARTEEGWRPVGDATLASDTLPIVIGEAQDRSRGFGKRVLRLLIRRAQELGWERLQVKHIYTYNQRSRRLYEGMGFQLAGTGETEAGIPFWRFELLL